MAAPRLQNPRLAELFKTPKSRTYTTAGVTAILVGVFIFFGIRPAINQIANLNREIDDKAEFLAKIEDKLETIRNLIEQKRSIEQKLTVFDEVFPYELKSGYLVANLASLADKYDTTLENVEFGESVEDLTLEVDDLENIVAVNVNIGASGDLNDLEDYARSLEEFSGILDVKAQSCTENNEDNQNPYSCNLSFYTYFWTEVAEEEGGAGGTVEEVEVEEVE